jgi:hypothetical protein
MDRMDYKFKIYSLPWAGARIEAIFREGNFISDFAIEITHKHSMHFRESLA